MNRHIELVRAVNSAKTTEEHDYRMAYLQGWRDGIDQAGGRWGAFEVDRDTELFYPGRPCCAGVLLDWIQESDICSEKDCINFGKAKAPKSMCKCNT